MSHRPVVPGMQKQARWLLLAPVLLAVSAASAQEPGGAGAQDPERAETLGPFARGWPKNILQDQKAILDQPVPHDAQERPLVAHFRRHHGRRVATDRRTSDNCRIRRTNGRTAGHLADRRRITP